VRISEAGPGSPREARAEVVRAPGRSAALATAIRRADRRMRSRTNGSRMRALRFILPAAVFAVIAWFLLAGLDRNPRDIPSPLIGKPAPDFSLPVTHDLARTWSPQSLRGKVWLLNVWGSWCAACQVEHPVLNDLARTGEIPIIGLAWKDMPENSIAWLRKLGNPYSVVVSDVQGRVGIDYGVYGAPETFLIDGAGIIRYKHVGPVTPELLQRKLLPLARELAAS